jgi:RNA recognition motif-containing protein
MKNIYVGNLDFNATEEQLRSLFAAHGNVEKVHIVLDRDTGQPRGFAFIEMTNDAEAEGAVKALNGAVAGAGTINVNETRPRLESSKGHDSLRLREHRRHGS